MRKKTFIIVFIFALFFLIKQSTKNTNFASRSKDLNTFQGGVDTKNSETKANNISNEKTQENSKVLSRKILETEDDNPSELTQNDQIDLPNNKHETSPQVIGKNSIIPKYQSIDDAYENLMTDEKNVCCAVDARKIKKNFTFKEGTYRLDFINHLIQNMDGFDVGHEENKRSFTTFYIQFKSNLDWIFPLQFENRMSDGRTASGVIIFTKLEQEKYKSNLKDQVLLIPPHKQIITYAQPLLYKLFPEKFQTIKKGPTEDGNDVCKNIVIVPQGLYQKENQDDPSLINLIYCKISDDSYVKLGLAVIN
jgi:hypothetical protein